jgi:sorbitol/mannitol transport system substrate-binding protein
MPGRVRGMVLVAVSLALTAGLVPLPGQAAPTVTLTIATVNNPDMIIMQKLTPAFEQQNPNIKVNWVVLPENELRQKVTTDISTNAGSYDVMTIGMYEVLSGWAKNGWLLPFESLPSDYNEQDLLKPVRAGLSYKGALYAVPFYAESSMTYYRKDLLAAKGLTMPQRPTWTQMETFAKAIHDPSKRMYGICLRGLPGWGENMAFLTTLVNTYGGRWFDEKWQPQLTSSEWKKAVGFYVRLMRNYGPPGVTSNGFTENETLLANGNCAMWVDATVAAGYLANPKTSKVAKDVGFAYAPMAVTRNGSHWLWAWALGIPKSTKKADAARTFVYWATSKAYINLVGEKDGWASVPPGTRYSTYQNPDYLKAAPFAKLVEALINEADPTHPTAKPVPYVGIQFVGIPEFQGIGTQTGQAMAGALAGKMTIDQALQQSQSNAENVMRQAGYIK